MPILSISDMLEHSSLHLLDQCSVLFELNISLRGWAYSVMDVCNHLLDFNDCERLSVRVLVSRLYS